MDALLWCLERQAALFYLEEYLSKAACPVTVYASAGVWTLLLVQRLYLFFASC